MCLCYCPRNLENIGSYTRDLLQIKETKLTLLMNDYKNFQMKDMESISDMFTRFINIVNKVRELGKEFGKEELIRKVFTHSRLTGTPRDQLSKRQYI